MPAQTKFVSASGTGWTCAEVSGTVTCTRAANTAVAAPALSNPAETDAENEVVLDNNNDATVLAGVGEPGFDLSIVSIVDNPDPALRGQALVYTVVGNNTGTTTANNVEIELTLPTSGAVFMGCPAAMASTAARPCRVWSLARAISPVLV